MFLDTSFMKNDEIFLRLDRTAEADPARGWVPAYHFTICLPDGTPAGKCDLRIGYCQKLYFGGHVGYTVFPAYRGHHYAGKACLLLFELARKHGMEYLYITCNVTNPASARTCEYAGGKLVAIEDVPEDNEMYKDGIRQVRVYRFAL